MELNYTLTFQDILAFNDYVAERFPKRRKMFWFMLLSVPIISLFISLLFGAFSWEIFLGTLIFWIIFSVFYHKWGEKIFRHWYIKIMLKDSNLNGQRTIQFDEHGINSEMNGAISKYTWNLVQNIEQNDKYIFVFLDRIRAEIIPKRFFKTADDSIIFYNKIIDFWKSVKGNN